MRVLFIGNSHTFVHYVPLRVSAYFEEQGEPLEAVMLTHPGVGLDWHLEQSQTYFNLLCGDYDAVVMQHNAHPFPGRESLITAGEKMAALVPAGTKVYLYMTWSEKTNPEGQQVMSEAYEELRIDPGHGSVFDRGHRGLSGHGSDPRHSGGDVCQRVPDQQLLCHLRRVQPEHDQGALQGGGLRPDLCGDVHLPQHRGSGGLFVDRVFL